jgi:hypothetical protein
LTIITLTTPNEFRYIDYPNTGQYGQTSPVDNDILLFTSSVLRTQLEIDLMLKQQDDHLMITSFNFKKKRDCFSKFTNNLIQFMIIT